MAAPVHERAMTTIHHRAAVLDFQRGESTFVWGALRSTGEPWTLDAGRARLDRAFVKAHVGCPVPGCGARLTTVARTTSRDGMRHEAGTGNHTEETIDHATGCLAVHAWLTRTHPTATVTREALLPDGTRRADVLAVNPDGDAVTVEIQYSAITPDTWRARHDDYARHSILDVWLWGHRGRNFHPTGINLVQPTPAQLATVDAGLPLLFINPERNAIAIAYTTTALLDEHARPTRRTAHTLEVTGPAQLEIHPISSFQLSRIEGITSTRLRELRASTDTVRAHNDAMRELAASRAAAAAAEHATRRALERAREQALRDRITALMAEQHRIRTLVDAGDPAAHNAIATYFAGNDVPLEIDRTTGTFVRWQARIYFHLVAGTNDHLSKFDALRLVRRELLDGHTQPQALALIDEYCQRLITLGHLHPNGRATFKGRWGFDAPN